MLLLTFVFREIFCPKPIHYVLRDLFCIYKNFISIFFTSYFNIYEKVRVTNGVDSNHLHCAGNLVERDIRIEDVLDLGEKFNDVLFVSRNKMPTW